MLVCPLVRPGISSTSQGARWHGSASSEGYLRMQARRLISIREMPFGLASVFTACSCDPLPGQSCIHVDLSSGSGPDPGFHCKD